MITAAELARFGELVEARLGLRLDPDRAATSLDTLGRRATAWGESVRGYLDRLAVRADDAGETGELARGLTVGETYFFRHVEQLDAFVAVVLPARAEVRGPATPLSVLSAACSSGEEAYSLAMLVRERTPALASRVAVHAFDANPAAVGRARAGRYSRWSLRATPPASERRWFRPAGRDYEVVPELRQAVTFAEGNLVEAGPLLAPGRWDVIFCRNALMYLSEARMREAIDRLAAALVPGGYLFLGHAESLRGRPALALALCATHGAFYYQREALGIASSAPPAAASGTWMTEIAAATQRVQAIVDEAQRLPPEVPVAAADGEGSGRRGALAEVRALVAAERYADASVRLAALPADVASSREAGLLRAVALTHAGGGRAAERACTEMIGDDPVAAGGHYLLALCRDGANDPVAAARAARRASELDPTFAMARVQLGLLARRAGDHAAAAVELGAAIELLEREDEMRLALYGGGFGRRALIGLCRAELAAAPVAVERPR